MQSASSPSGRPPVSDTSGTPSAAASRNPHSRRRWAASTSRSGSRVKDPPRQRRTEPLRRAVVHHQRAGGDRGVEEPRLPHPQRGQRAGADHRAAHGGGVAGREHRLRLHESEPTARPDPRQRVQEEDRAQVGVRRDASGSAAPPVARGQPFQLVGEGRVPDHHVEAPGLERAGGEVARLELADLERRRPRTPRPPRRRRRTRRGTSCCQDRSPTASPTTSRTGTMRSAAVGGSLPCPGQVAPAVQPQDDASQLQHRRVEVDPVHRGERGASGLGGRDAASPGVGGEPPRGRHQEGAGAARGVQHPRQRGVGGRTGAGRRGAGRGSRRAGARRERTG